MNNDLLLEGKTYISVSRASKKLGYTADYIGQLCRAGKIDARMIGRTWYVEWESVKNHKKSKKHRVRRTAEEIKKAPKAEMSYLVPPVLNSDLKAQKDKDCPPEEYLEKVDEAVKKEGEEKKMELIEPISNYIPLSAVKDNTKENPTEIYVTGEYSKHAEEALPISYLYDHQSAWLPKLNKKTFSPETKRKSILITRPNTLFAAALGLFIFLNFLFVGMSVLSPRINSHPIVKSIENSLNLFDSNKTLTVNIERQNKKNNYHLRNIDNGNLTAAYTNFATIFNYFTDKIIRKVNTWAVGYLRSLGFIPQTKSEVTNRKQGLVVVPDVDDHNNTVASIRDTFSDEVIIQEDPDGGSGIIIPKFKYGEGGAYTYVLIPVDSP